MKSSLAVLTLLLAAPAFAEDASPTPSAPAPRVAAPAPKQPALKMSLNFRGTLHDTLRELADKGHVNLVITSTLDEPAEVYLKNVTAEEALQSVAAAYHLNVEHQGNVWTVHRDGALLPPLPPALPVPPIAPAASASEEKAEAESGDDDDDEKDEAQQAKEDAKQAVEDAKEQQKDAEQAKQDAQKAAHDAAQAIVNSTMAQVRGKKHHHHHSGRDYSVTGNGRVESGATVADAVAFGGNLEVDGDVTGDAFAMGGNLDVHGHVEGDATAMGGSVHLFPDSKVEGDVQALGGSVIKDEGATVGGDTSNIAGGRIPSAVLHRPREDGERSAFLRFFLEFAVLFAVGFLAMIFAPDRMRRLQAELKTEPWRCGLTGFVGSLALMALTFLLCVTLIGAPFAFFLVLLVCVGWAMGIAAAASEVGLRLPFFRNRKTQAVVLAMGLVLLLLLKMIPVVGPLMIFLLSMVVLGALIRTRFGSAPRLGIPERIESPAGV
jgi:hypothetical protein